MKIAGLRKRGITYRDFETGFVTSKRMQTINTVSDLSQAGTFVTENRNLMMQYHSYSDYKNLMKNRKIYIDADINTIDDLGESIKWLRD